MSKSSIIVPVRGRSDYIEVFYDELPEDPSDVIEMLRAELAPLEIWSEFAVAYFSRGRDQQFCDILLGVVDAFDVYEMQDFYRKDKKEFTSGRLRILNLLSASATSAFVNDLDKESRDASRYKILDFIGRADDINPEWQPTMLCKAFFWIGEYYHDKRALQNAEYYTVALSRKHQHHSLASSLAVATTNFHQNKYAHSMRIFAELIQATPERISTHLGLGLSALAIGESALAQRALKRALALDPKNAVALVATAQARLLNASDQDLYMESATQMIQRATELKPSYSAALSHYAHRLFWKWQKAPFIVQGAPNNFYLECAEDPSICLSIGYDIRLDSDKDGAFQARILAIAKPQDTWIIRLSSPLTDEINEISDLVLFFRDTNLVGEMASKAFHCTNVITSQAEAYFILGRNCHDFGDMKAALDYYAQACKLRPEFSLAQFRLAQVHAALGNMNDAIEAARCANKLTPDSFEVTLLLGVLFLALNNIEESSKQLHVILNAFDHEDQRLEYIGRKKCFAQMTLAAVSEIIARKSGKRVALMDTINKYEALSATLTLHSIHAPIELLNNLGVLYFEMGAVEKAGRAFLQALNFLSFNFKSSENRFIDSTYSNASKQSSFRRQKLITVILNMIEFLIALGYLDLAQKTIQYIQRLIPTNTRCRLFVVCLNLLLENKIRGATDMSKLLNFKDRSLPSPESKSMNKNFIFKKLAMLNDFELKQDMLASALTFKLSMQKHLSESNFFNKVMYPHLFFMMQQNQPAEEDNRIASRNTYRRLIGDQVATELRDFPSCVAVAGTVGIALARFGFYRDANSIFRSVCNSLDNRRGTPTDQNGNDAKWTLHRGALSALKFSFLLNKAHISLLSGDVREASSGYSSCMKMLQTPYSNVVFNGMKRKANVVSLISYCFLECGEKRLASRAMSAAIRMNPSDLVLRCALTSQLAHLSNINASSSNESKVLMEKYVSWISSCVDSSNSDPSYQQFFKLVDRLK